MEDARPGSMSPGGDQPLARQETAANPLRSEPSPVVGSRTAASRFVRHAPSAFIAIPVLWAVCAYAVGSVPRPMAPEPKRAALAFAQHIVDLGPARPSPEVYGTFRFMNRGKNAVAIRKIEPSCSCLKIEWQEIRKKVKKTRYAPGESGHFVVRLETSSQPPGLKEFGVTVEYDDPEPQSAAVTFKVILPDDKVSVYPPALDVAYIGTTTDTVRTIEIVDRRPHPLSIRNVECTRKGIFGIGPVASEIDELGFTHFRFDVTIPGDLPAGYVQAVIGVYTDDEDFRVLPVRIRVRSMDPLVRKASPIVDANLQQAGATSDDER